MRPHPRLARVNPSSPRAWGTCGRCGFISNLCDMVWQHDWRGLQIQNLKLLVCTPCLDQPQRQLGAIILPPDPPAIMNARPEPYSIDELSNLSTEDGDFLVTQGDTDIVSAPIPAPEDE